jgi:hypothetical protein
VAKPAAHDWLQLLLRSCLKALNNNTPLTIMLEHTDSAQQYVTSEYICDAHITEGFFSLLFDHHVYDPQKMLWITHNGIIRGINSSWKARWHTDVHDVQSWKENAIVYTTKSDMLLLYLDTSTHTCSIALNGTIHELLTIEHAGIIIKKHMRYETPSIKKGMDHGIIHQKNSVEQHTT